MFNKIKIIYNTLLFISRYVEDYNQSKEHIKRVERDLYIVREEYRRLYLEHTKIKKEIKAIQKDLKPPYDGDVRVVDVFCSVCGNYIRSVESLDEGDIYFCSKCQNNMCNYK